MKNAIFYSLLALVFVFTSCNQQKDVDAMLKDAETKNEIFSTILQDQSLFNDFMNEMMADENTMMTMQGNSKMMGHMMGQGHMMNTIMGDSEMSNTMLSHMMQNGNMMARMMQMMNQEGMMSEDCLQSTIQMMKDKGMPMDTGMMQDGDSSMEK